MTVSKDESLHQLAYFDTTTTHACRLLASFLSTVTKVWLLRLKRFMVQVLLSWSTLTHNIYIKIS